MQPPYLTSGSLIGITCPAGYVSHERVEGAVTILELWGFRVRLGATVGSEYHYFSGTDARRLADLQSMMDDPEVAAILMGRGGYGMSRIIDGLSLDAFSRHPKWICGFSDITVLHSHLQAQLGAHTLHSPMCGAFRGSTAAQPHILSLRAQLLGQPVSYEIDPSPFNRVGEVTAPLTGGNVAILAHLTGSVSEVDTDGRILFIEDVGEHLYNIDRLLLNLKRAGKLQRLAALLVGSFTELQDTARSFGQTVEEIIADKVAEYDYPVCFGFPCGHQEVNYALRLGAVHTLSVTGTGSRLTLQS